MKRVFHRIPLAKQVVKILEEIHQDLDQGTNRVVPSSRIIPLSDMAFANILRSIFANDSKIP